VEDEEVVDGREVVCLLENRPIIIGCGGVELSPGRVREEGGEGRGEGREG
jgi:hypothetical protein